MGELKNNNVMGTTSGKVGLVVFRQVRGKMIASNRPPRGRRDFSVKQQGVLTRFKRAARYATAALADATLKAVYAARVNARLFTPRLVAIISTRRSSTTSMYRTTKV